MTDITPQAAQEAYAATAELGQGDGRPGGNRGAEDAERKPGKRCIARKFASFSLRVFRAYACPLYGNRHRSAIDTCSVTMRNAPTPIPNRGASVRDAHNARSPSVHRYASVSLA